ncbi:MAG: FdtA/QdtA family cupin domain-containing protein [Byssovorax sp.]
MTAPITSGVDACKWLDFPGHSDDRGALTFMESPKDLPFDVRRIYYLYDVPEGKARGAHAHRALRQVFIAIAGSFTLLLDDGDKQREVRLDSPRRGLYVPPMLWRDLRGFSPGAICVVLASAGYQESDYIRDHAAFLEAARAGQR